MTFEAVAELLLPADPGRRGAVVRAGRDWRFDPPPDALEADALVWGRGVSESGTRRSELLRRWIARRRAVARLRSSPPPPFEALVHPWPPDTLRGGPTLRNRLRASVLAGALVELARPPRSNRVLDACTRAAGATATAALRPGAGGQVLTRVRLPHGVGILRAARADTAGDPWHAAEALERMAAAGSTIVPRLLGRDETLAARWTTESELPGRRPAELTEALLEEAIRFCASLPTSGTAPTAPEDDLEAIARHLPDRAAVLDVLRAEISSQLSNLPGVLRHGDLWAGNLLTSGGRLAGVIDWGSWHPAGAPGTDVLHLLANEEGLRTRRGLGAMWASRPWRSVEFEQAVAPYWASLEVRPTGDELEAVGLAWWAARVAATLQVEPELSTDEGWLGANVDPVLDRAG